MCPEWRAQRNILWAEVQEETGRWKSRWKIRDLLADGRCSRAVLGFLSSIDVGRLVPVEEEVRSEVSEWELRERREPEEERREEAEALGADDVLGAGGEPRCSFPPPRSWHRQARSRERATFSFVGIYGSIKGEDCELIVLQHYTGARSLYIQEGHRDKGRKTTPPSRCSGTQSCPDATSGPSSPDAHYSDIFFFFCSFLCDLPWCVSTLSRDRARR